MLPRELWLLVHPLLDGPSFQALAQTCKWQFQQYKQEEEVFLALMATIPAKHTLVDPPKSFDPYYFPDWFGRYYMTLLELSGDSMPFTIHTGPPCKEDIATLSSSANKKVHFNFQNRPKLRYIVDFEQWNVSAVELGDHVRNTSRHSEHRLVLNQETNELDEIAIENGPNGLCVVWKKPNPKDNLCIQMPRSPPLLEGVFNTWLSDRPKTAHDVFLYAESEFFEDNILVYYVNWEMMHLELVSKRCYPFDSYPLAMKNSLYSGICNGHFIYFTQDAIYVRNIVSGSVMLLCCQEPQLLHYDNRYFIYTDDNGEYVVDVVKGEVHTLSPRNILKAIPSIHMVSITEEKGVECWVPGWASLGQLKAGQSKTMSEGLYFGRIDNGELVFDYGQGV
ncbi:hypothetical protein CJU89_0661 [Yarrowia sp. B02]|nr:hypothetical protein CJU89_0661 [Yarrowia sp. B02]